MNKMKKIFVSVICLLLICACTGESIPAAFATDVCPSCWNCGFCFTCSGNGYLDCRSAVCNSGVCSNCNGTGKKFLGLFQCKLCNGSGLCLVCQGTGKSICNDCNGSGKCPTCGGDISNLHNTSKRPNNEINYTPEKIDIFIDDKLSYASDQFYYADWGTTNVYTVQFSAGKNVGSAEKNRDHMLDYGNDAFVYYKNDFYYDMTGKFRSYSDAKSYLKSVQKIMGAEDGFITSVDLPENAVCDFENIYYASNSNISSYYSGTGSRRWSTKFPYGFDCYAYDDIWTYYNKDYQMKVVISQQEICATSKKSRDAILSNAYETERSAHSSVTWDQLEDETFDVTGYNGSDIYYVRGVISEDMFYTIRFEYPEKNRLYCDSVLENVRDRFSTF